MLVLVAVHGPDKGRVLMLPEDRRHLIGRHCLSLSDRKISRRHARLEFYHGRWTIDDLGSTNGTFVNRQPIRASTPLNAGDRIRIGKTDFMFSLSRDNRTLPQPSARRASIVRPQPHNEPAPADADERPDASEPADDPGVPVACAEWADLVRGFRPPRQPLWPMAVAAVLLGALVLGNIVAYDAWTGRRLSPLPAAATTTITGAAPTPEPEAKAAITPDSTETRAADQQAQQSVLSALQQVTRNDRTPESDSDN